MKKIMIAASVAFAAVASQAMSINWGAGDVMAGSVGDWVGEYDKGYDYLTEGTGYFFMLGSGPVDSVAQAAADWAMLTTAADIWSAFDGVDTLTINGHSYKGDVVAFSEDPLAWTPTSANKDDKVYAAIILTAKDVVTGEDMYAANAFADTVGTSGLNSGADGYASLYWVNQAEGAESTWNAVPEPTSGLLLLLGVAGLALRRRRA